MSLVAYAVDSGEESETEDENVVDAIIVKPSTPQVEAEITPRSDAPLAFDHLPAPKAQITKSVIVEEDDEFLHKAATTTTTKSKVQITIPSLRDFQDVQTYKNENRDESAPLRRSATAPKKVSKLLNILPQAKSEMSFIKTKVNQQEKKAAPATVTPTPTPTPILPESTKLLPSVKKSVTSSLIPDSIRLGRKGCNTEDQIERVKRAPIKHKLAADSDSEEDVDGDGAAGTADFFSLNADDKNNQEVSEMTLEEVNALVQSRATKLTARANNLEAEELPDSEEQMDTNTAESSTHLSDLDAEALQTLVGRKAAKRARRGEENIQIMDLHGSEVLPSREEWMRSALAAATEYQPKGVLTDEEPASGTRRKHQITYLAHKAKANEAELQAMWAANRQTRRATQSKYGF